MTYNLVITTTFADGHTNEHAYYDREGTAADAHAALTKRWKAAGYTFDRDPKALTLTRHIGDESHGGPYTDVITHEALDGAP